jgi:putative transposase
VRERRDQLRHPAYTKPELLAERPNEVWSWDITKLLGLAKSTYSNLFVILDVFSRYAVGWSVQRLESAGVAQALIAQAACQRQIEPGTLTVHADRGSSMTSKPVALLLADLGVAKTHSRPCTPTDNPYSEAHFRTLKYRPGFPARFDSIEQARAFCREFFDWYIHHRHSGLGLMTPAAVHYGRAKGLHAGRASVLAEAYAATQGASSDARRNRPRCRRQRGSTSPPERRLRTEFDPDRLLRLDRRRAPRFLGSGRGANRARHLGVQVLHGADGGTLISRKMESISPPK